MVMIIVYLYLFKLSVSPLAKANNNMKFIIYKSID